MKHPPPCNTTSVQSPREPHDAHLCPGAEGNPGATGACRREGFLDEVVWSRDGAGEQIQARCLPCAQEWSGASAPGSLP